MLSRRQFLKRAVATGAVAAIAPSLLLKTAKVPSVTVAQVKGLSYKELEGAYTSAVLGREEPDMIILTSRAYRLLRKLYNDPRYINEFVDQEVAWVAHNIDRDLRERLA